MIPYEIAEKLRVNYVIRLTQILSALKGQQL
jgi:hypothetical protein